MDAVSIPVMAKARIGHFVEAQILEALGVDYIDESEVLTPADESNHIDKHAFKVPFVCGCRNLGEALRRINEGAAMMRTKGEAGTGNIVEAVRQLRDVLGEIRRLQGMREDELFVAAKDLGAPYELVKRRRGRWQAAGRELRRRRDQHAGRCGARHAARRRGRLRRLGHLQGRGPGPDGERDRAGDDLLRRRRRRSPRSRRAWEPRCAASPSRRSPTRSDSPFAAGRRPHDSPTSPRMKIGVLALQGAFREHLDTLRAIGVDGVRVREPADLDGVSGLILPGGESTTMRQLIERWGLREPILDLAERGAPIFGTCAGMIVLATEIAGGEAADPAAARRDGGAQRLRAPARLVRGRAAGPDPGRHAGPRRLHPGARSSSGPVRTSTSWRGWTTAGSWPSASATSSRPRSIPSWPARPASTA